MLSILDIIKQALRRFYPAEGLLTLFLFTALPSDILIVV